MRGSLWHASVFTSASSLSSFARALSALSRHQCNSAAPSNPATALAAPEPLPTRKLCCTTTAAARVPGASMADTPEPLSEYEQARNEKIARNRAFLAALGLGDAQSSAAGAAGRATTRYT